MIDVAREVTCKACGKPIKQAPGGHRRRLYCDDTCKMRYRRKLKAVAKPTETERATQQTIAALQEKLMRCGTEKEKVERRVQTQRGRIGELEAEGRRLRSRVEELLLELRDVQRTIDQLRTIEEVFRTDTDVHPLKRFLASSPYHASRPGCVKILDKEYGFVPSGSRGTYIDLMRRAGFSADEQANVWEAWHDMLKDELFKSYYANRNQS